MSEKVKVRDLVSNAHFEVELTGHPPKWQMNLPDDESFDVTLTDGKRHLHHTDGLKAVVDESTRVATITRAGVAIVALSDIEPKPSVKGH